MWRLLEAAAAVACHCLSLLPSIPAMVRNPLAVGVDVFFRAQIWTHFDSWFPMSYLGSGGIGFGEGLRRGASGESKFFNMRVVR